MFRAIFGMFLVTLIVFPVPAVAQAPTSQIVGDPVRTKEGRIEVTYSLEATPDQEYEVGLFLCREEGNLVKKRGLKRVSGDVGARVLPGSVHKIVWDPVAESLDIVEGEQYWFEVTIVPISRGGIAWYMYAGGGAILGGTAYLLLAKKTAPPTGGIPLPPGRPE